MEANIRSLIQAALDAPSGENAQPWRFREESGGVSLYHNPGSDESLYNYNNFGTMVCEGAALENMLVMADTLGLNVRLETLPDPSYTNLIGRITLAGTKAAANQPLGAVIPSRTTNRKAYKKTALKAEDVKAIENAAASFAADGITMLRITDRKKINRLAEVGSSNERIMLGNEELHSFFFSHLTWTKQEDEKQKTGFYIKTLELPPPAQFLFKLFRSWKVMQSLKKLGFTKMVGKQNAGTYAASAEFGIITVPSLTPKNMILAGRAFERIWLTAASRGIELQPLTGTIFMQFFAENVPTGHFSPEERSLLKQEIGALYAESGVTNSKIVLMYRLGYGSKPSTRATRFKVEDMMI
jgi:nitroreductase